MAEKTYVCGYKHCQIKEKVQASEAVIVGNRRYHKECSEIRDKICQITDLYIDYIDKKVLMQELLGVLNRIIFTNGIGLDYMIFAVQHIVDMKIKLKSPYALYYVAKNKRIITLWEKQNKKSGD